MTLQLASAIMVGKRDESVGVAPPGSEEVSPMELYHRLHVFKGVQAGATREAADLEWRTRAAPRLGVQFACLESAWQLQHSGR